MVRSQQLTLLHSFYGRGLFKKIVSRKNGSYQLNPFWMDQNKKIWMTSNNFLNVNTKHRRKLWVKSLTKADQLQLFKTIALNYVAKNCRSSTLDRGEGKVRRNSGGEWVCLPAACRESISGVGSNGEGRGGCVRALTTVSFSFFLLSLSLSINASFFYSAHKPQGLAQ
jgi:hypothetical protein